MPNIFIVGNHADEIAAVRKLFESQNEFAVCGEAVNGVEAVKKAKRLSPDLIILDTSVPIVEGLEVAQTLKRAMPHVPLFLLTRQYDVATERTAISWGISAVFAKDDPRSLILNARAVCMDTREEDGDRGRH